jgi:transcriptional regulator of nitric oxide reductase
VEYVIRVHLESAYENQWGALVTGCQVVADQLAITVGEIADDFEKCRAELEQEGSADPAALRSVEGLRNSVP